jgi:hypothetical protein
MLRLPLEKYQAIVRSVHPLIDPKRCELCGDDFRRIVIWEIVYDIDRKVYLCKKCCPTHQHILTFCRRKNIVIKSFE